MPLIRRAARGGPPPSYVNEAAPGHRVALPSPAFLIKHSIVVNTNQSISNSK